MLIDEVYRQLKHEWMHHIMQNFPQNGTIKEQIEHIWFRHIDDWGLRFSASLCAEAAVGALRSGQRRGATASARSACVWFRDCRAGMADGLFVPISAEYFGMLMVANLDAAVQYASAHHLKDMALTRHITTSFEIFWKGLPTSSFLGNQND